MVNFSTSIFTLLTKRQKTQYTFFIYTFTLQSNTRELACVNLNFLYFPYIFLPISHLHFFLPPVANQTGPKMDRITQLSRSSKPLLAANFNSLIICFRKGRRQRVEIVCARPVLRLLKREMNMPHS